MGWREAAAISVLHCLQRNNIPIPTIIFNMKDNRKDFIKKSVALAAMSAGGIGTALSETLHAKTKDWTESGFQGAFKESTIRIAIQAPLDATANELSFYRQMGMKHVVLWTDETKASAEYYSDRKKYFADAGLEVYGFGNRSVHNEEKIVLNLPGREEKIEQYRQHLRDLGKAGITYTTYAHMGNGIWSSERETTRAGASARSFDLKGPNWGEWNGKKYYPPLSHGREYTLDEMWENFKYFIHAVTPVAEQNNVRIGIHPDDPPVPKLAGVPRIFSHYDGYKRALDLAKSPNVGLCLCVGSWMEGGNKMGKDALGMIDYFGKQNKIFKIHFRNIDKPLPHFTETFVDNGYTDMYKIMKALKKVNFDGVLIADHIPGMIAPAPRNNNNNATAAVTPSATTALAAAPANYRGLAFSIGYIKSLRDRVEDEAGNYQNAPI
jgi:mannonate dehydratase